MKSKFFQLLPAVLSLLPFVASADNLYIVESGANKISKYTTAGSVVSPALITGLNNPSDLVLDGQGDVLVANLGSARVSEYTTSGGVVNLDLVTNLTVLASNPRGLAMQGGTNLFIAHLNGHAIGRYTISNGVLVASSPAFISGLGFPFALALSGTDLYMANYVSYDNKVAKFTTAGATVNSSLTGGISPPYGLAVDGTNLFVSSYSDGKIMRFATNGLIINTNFITGLPGPCGLAVDGKGGLYVANYSAGTIGKYDVNSGAAINASLISGLNSPLNIEIEVLGPQLAIAKQAGNVIVSWPQVVGFLLQTNSNLRTTDWAVYPNVSLLNGTNSAAFISPTGSLFFRLISP